MTRKLSFVLLTVFLSLNEITAQLPSDPVTRDYDYNPNSNLGFQFIPDTYQTIPNVPINQKSASILMPNYQGKYLLKIFDVDNPQIFAVSDTFQIKFNPGFYFYKPAGNEIWQVDSTREIIFDAINIGKLRMEYSTDSGNKWNVIESSLQSDSNTIKSFSYKWKVPDFPSGNCLIKLTSLDNPDITATSGIFEITTREVIGYFPLSIGNKWFYKQKDISYPDGRDLSPISIQQIWEVIDSKKSADGTDYFYISTSMRRDQSQNTFQTTDTIKINQNKNEVDISSKNLLKLGPSVFSINFITTDYRVSSDNILNKPLHVFTIGEPYSYHTLTDSIGITIYNGQDWYGSLETYLAGAVLNGKVYGQILSDYIVGVKVEEPLVPSNYSLSQNYPNPFNPVTTIKYSIPVDPANVGRRIVSGKWETTHRVVSTLKVYDILGREVATLVNEEKSPGNYEVKFDGSKFTSGVYFYRLQAGSFSQTKKLILIK